MSSPTQRALKIYRQRGCKVFITEKWNTFARIRQDAFGFGDLLVIDVDSSQILLVQVTSGANHNARVKKILGIPEASAWIKAGGKIAVMSFKKMKNGRYEMKEEFINV